MTLNGVIALILYYLTEFDSFRGRLHNSVCRISLSSFGHYWPTQQRGLSTIAELLV